MNIRINNKCLQMVRLLPVLVNELGETEGASVYNWYLKSYNLRPDSIAPDFIRREIIGR